MKRAKICLLTCLVLLPIVSCSNPPKNIIIVPASKDSYSIVKVISDIWRGGTLTIGLYDRNNNMTTCTGKFRIAEDSLLCEGDKYSAHMKCVNNRYADVRIITSSCTQAYGIAIGDRGDEYEIYMGLTDEAMKAIIEGIDYTRKYRELTSSYYTGQYLWTDQAR